MKAKVVFTRPAYWGKCESEKLDLHYVSLSGIHTTILRNKKVCGDSVGGVLTKNGELNLEAKFEKVKPDVFLWWATYSFDGTELKLGTVLKTLKRLKSIAPKCKFLYGNGNQQGVPDFNMEAFKPLIDGVLINTRDKREVAMYKQWGLKHVHTLHTFGFDPKKHGPAIFGTEVPKYDCFFGGSQTCDIKRGKPVAFYPQSKMLNGKYMKSKMRLDFLSEVNKRFNLLVRGKGKWPFPVAPYLHGEDYPMGFGQTKIALGMYHWDLERYYTKRTIYSGASGRLLITHYIPGMEKDFTNGKNIVWFRTPEEGIEKIAFYLAHDNERELIAAAQREHFIKNHSWEPRLREFEKVVEKIL